MREFNVIIENNGSFEPYNIMPYLQETWEEFKKKALEISKEQPQGDNSYWKIPQTREEFRKWIKSQLQYQYWGRCQYEILLLRWPPRTDDNNNITPDTPKKKIDIYEQCEMNLDTITDLFLENIEVV